MKKISVFVLLSCLCFIFCTKNSTTEPDNTPLNHAPVITSMTAVPAVLNINMASQVDSAIVTVIATDVDDISLTYTFNAVLGKLSSQNGGEITYTPPAEQGDYFVSCSVRDGNDTVVRSVTVSVSQPDPEYEFAPETILINRHLTVFFGPSWDPRFRDQRYSVTLEPYRIAKYELKNIEYYQFVKEGGYDNASWWSEAGWNTKIDSGWIGPMYWGLSESPWLDDSYSQLENTPVHGISFYESEAYCNWLSEKTGIKYSIPKSAQWQRAAKGPYPGYKYPWGNEYIENNLHFIWWLNMYDPEAVEDFVELIPVNSIPEGQSQDGCFHMLGNVYEYAMPLYENNYNYIIFYAYELTSGDPKRDMTTASNYYTKTFKQLHGLGLRVCREY